MSFQTPSTADGDASASTESRGARLQIRLRSLIRLVAHRRGLHAVGRRLTVEEAALLDWATSLHTTGNRSQVLGDVTRRTDGR